MQKQLKNIILFLFFFSATIFFSTATYANSSNSGCLMADSLELVDFYNALGGPSWGNSWDLNTPVNTWTGVTLSASGCNVESISIQFNNINGNFSLIKDIDLPNLKTLHLSGNSLSGNIPDFSKIPNLERLTLDGNNLSGVIPDFQNLALLEQLKLSFNQLNGTIPNFANTPNLEIFIAVINQLSGTIPDFSNTPNLTILELSKNNLSGQIPNLSNSPNLVTLGLEDNQLSGTIPNFSLNSLQALLLNQNFLEGNIPDFLSAPNLQTINIRYNQLSGAIPNFTYLNNLSTLIIQNNQFNFSDINNYFSTANINGVTFFYAQQATVPIYYTNNTLYVAAGGNLANNTYNWYADNVLVGTFTGDSTFVPTITGNYHCEITNSIVTNSGNPNQNLILNAELHSESRQVDALGGEYVPNELVVQLGDITQHVKDSIKNDLQATTIDSCLCGNLELWQLPDIIVANNNPLIDLESQKEEARTKTKVEDGGFNYILDTNSFSKKKKNTGKKTTGKKTVIKIEKPLYSAPTQSNHDTVKLAIIDTGLDFETIPDSLRWENSSEIADNQTDDDGNCIIDDNLGYDFVNKKAPIDSLGHGTAVGLSALFADKKKVRYSISDLSDVKADSISLMNIKVYSESYKTLWNLICGMWYARDKQADVVAISSGYSGEKSTILEGAVRALNDDCILVVTSAGNDSAMTDTLPHYPSSIASDNVISVAATNFFTGELKSYSNFGLQSVDIGYPDSLGIIDSEDRLEYYYGTSYAAGSLAGIAIYLKSRYPWATARDIRNAIFLGADKIPSLNGKLATGGIANIDKASAILDSIGIANSELCICQPVVNCQNLSAQIGSDGSLTIDATQFDNGSYTNCANGAVTLAFSKDINETQRNFSCEDIGINQFDIFIIDDEGNDAIYSAQLEVIDTLYHCVQSCQDKITLEGIIPERVYHAADSLISNGIIQTLDNVEFKAGEVIILKPGFEVQLGADFLATIVNCNVLLSPRANTDTVIIEIPVTPTLKVYPNPIKNHSTIEYHLPQDAPVSIKLYNTATGQQVQSLLNSQNFAGVHQLSFNKGSIPSGLYILTLQTNQVIISQKIIIQ